MAWQAPSPIFLAAGQTVTLGYSWGVDRPYMGVQVLQPRPSVGIVGTPFWVDKVAQGISYFGRQNPDGSVTDEWTYFVTFREMFGRDTIVWMNGGEVAP